MGHIGEHVKKSKAVRVIVSFALALGMCTPFGAVPSAAADESMPDGMRASVECKVSEYGNYAFVVSRAGAEDQIAFCFDYTLDFPMDSKVTYTHYRPGTHVTDYIVAKGWPATRKIAGSSWSHEEARMITQAASWMAGGWPDVSGAFGDYPQVDAAAKKFYAEAKAYKGGDEDIDGRSMILSVDGGADIQPMLTGNFLEVERGGIVIGKGDAERYRHSDGSYYSYAQGDASFAGATFAIYNRSGKRIWADIDGDGVKDDGETFADDALVRTISTAYNSKLEAYVASTREKELQLGTYEVVETQAPAGYRNSGTVKRTVKIDKDGQIVQLVQADGILNDVLRGGVRVEKQDAELGAGEAVGGFGHSTFGAESYAGSSLSGIRFEISNASAHGVMVNGTYYAPGAKVTEISSAWNAELAAYTAQTDAQLLPYGTYTIRETQTNGSYLLTDGRQRRFEVREQGALVTADADGNALVWRNRVVRNDMHLQKQAEDSNKLLANVAFLVTNTTTGERHVVVTDRNGMLNTSAQLRPHSANTNANDKFAGGMEIRTEDIVADAGVWFGMGEDGSMSEPDDARGALPYGHYTIAELRCEANAGYELWSDSFDVLRDTSATTLDVDLGTVVDRLIRIGTDLTDASDGDHYVQRAESVELVDRVGYSGLTADDTEYTMEGWLIDKATGQTAVDAAGKELRLSVTFTATQESGNVEMHFAFNASTLAGTALVAFERLTCDKDVLASHEDADDEGQTVRVVDIGTVLGDVDGNKEVAAAADAKLVDTVSYQGLKTDGTEYTMAGMLMDKKSGNALTDSYGEALIVQTRFTPAEPDGQVKVRFAVDTSELAGRELVAFEACTASDTAEIIARHEDMDDAGQTVRVKGAEAESTPDADAPRTGTPAVKTSDEAAMLFVGLTCAVIAATGAGMYALKRRRSC